MPGGDGSMFEKISEHEERIIVLEKSDIEILKRVKEVESNYVNLENTILKGNQSQQDFFRDTLNKQWDLITERDKSKDAQREREHVLLVGKQGIAKGNWDNAWKIFGQAAGVGGILFVIIEFWLTK